MVRLVIQKINIYIKKIDKLVLIIYNINITEFIFLNNLKSFLLVDINKKLFLKIVSLIYVNINI